MPKRIKHKGRKRPTDVNLIAHRLVQMSTEEAPAPIADEPEKPPVNIAEYLASIGRKGGKIGGKRRLTTMTAKARKKIASKAAKARWGKTRKQD